MRHKLQEITMDSGQGAGNGGLSGETGSTAAGRSVKIMKHCLPLCDESRNRLGGDFLGPGSSARQV